MRKSYLFGAAAVVLLLALVAMQFARPSKAESPRLERYLPAETIGFVEVSDLRAQALRIIESEAWREFSKENQAASSLFMMTANHAGALDASYAFALVGMEATGEGRHRPQFIAIAEFESASARRVFERRVLSLTREASERGAKARTEEHEGTKIKLHAPEKGAGFAYAQVGDTLYLSNGVASIKRALDVRAGKTPSLETNQTFLQARAQAKYSDGMFGFLDGAAMTRLIDSVPEQGAGHGLMAFRQFFHGVGADSVQSVAFTSTFEDGRVAERFVVVAPNRTGVLGTVGANPPTPQALLALVPADARQVFDASIANAPQTFDQLLALAAQAGEETGRKGPIEGLAEFAAKTGVDLRGEIVGVLGDEICLAQIPDGEGRTGVVILNVRDAEAFGQTLRRLGEQKGATHTEREYRGVTVSRVAGEKGHGFEYAFVSGHAVLSGSARGVESVIETAQGASPSLKSSAEFRAATEGAHGAQFIYYNTNADYLNRLGRMLKSGEQEFKTTGQSATLRPSVAYGVSRPEGFFVESRTPLGTFPRLLTTVTAKFGGEQSAEQSSEKNGEKNEQKGSAAE
jgi:hypothetical protein